MSTALISNLTQYIPKLLWSNPNPGSNISAGQIQLDRSGKDYTYYRVIAAESRDAATSYACFDFLKGHPCNMFFPATDNVATMASSQIILLMRSITASSDTSFTINDAGYKRSDKEWISGNNYARPIYLFGYNTL